MEKRTYRMYGLVPYNLSPIQQGIQYGHAVVEYAQRSFAREDYQKWATEDKTFIILNGGTTNDRRLDGDFIGSLNRHKVTLMKEGIRIADFREPDLGDQLTAVVFLVDDRVFDRETYPDYMGPVYTDGTPVETDYYNWKMKFADTEKEANQIVFLREFLHPRSFKLA